MYVCVCVCAPKRLRFVNLGNARLQWRLRQRLACCFLKFVLARLVPLERWRASAPCVGGRQLLPMAQFAAVVATSGSGAATVPLISAAILLFRATRHVGSGAHTSLAALAAIVARHTLLLALVGRYRLCSGRQTLLAQTRGWRRHTVASCSLPQQTVVFEACSV